MNGSQFHFALLKLHNRQRFRPSSQANENQPHKNRLNRNLPNKKRFTKSSGFTLMELIVVIIILGVMAVGIGGFI